MIESEDAASVRSRVARLRAAGLGDMVAAGLSAVGITPERVAAFTGRPCRCSQRKQKLNGLGHRLLGLPAGDSTTKN